RPAPWATAFGWRSCSTARRSRGRRARCSAWFLYTPIGAAYGPGLGLRKSTVRQRVGSLDYVVAVGQDTRTPWRKRTGPTVAGSSRRQAVRWRRPLLLSSGDDLARLALPQVRPRPARPGRRHTDGIEPGRAALCLPGGRPERRYLRDRPRGPDQLSP